MSAPERLGRDVRKPAVDLLTLRTHLSDVWGIDYPDGRELPGERDRNFLMSGPDHQSVVKVCHSATTRNDVEIRLAAIDALSEAPGFVVPVAETTADGAYVSSIELDSGRHLVTAVTYVPGRELGDIAPVADVHLEALGAAAQTIPDHLGAVTGAQDDFLWDLRRAPATIRSHLDAIADDDVRALVAGTVADCEVQLAPLVADLPVTTIHGDLNDANVVFDGVGRLGIFDFGDVHRSYAVAELAIAAAYATIRMADPMTGVVALVRGATARRPLVSSEAGALVPLLRLRLASSVAIGAAQVAAEPDNPYLAVSQADALAALRRWGRMPGRLATAHVRHASGLPAIANGRHIHRWIARHAASFSSPLELPLSGETVTRIDWSVTSPHVAHPDAGETVADGLAVSGELMRRAGACVGLGCWGEPRLVYATPDYDLPSNGPPRTRTVHTGVDLSCPVGTEVRALCAGVVERIDNDAVDGGYGPVVTLRHDADGVAFWSLYGHLSATVPLEVGDVVATGDRIGAVGAAEENGGWPPHLHFQLMTDLLDFDGPFPGVAAPDEWEVWAQICPSPAAALGLDETVVTAPQPDDDAVAGAAIATAPPSLRTSYATPLVAVRGIGAHLYDGWGRRYLDCVNNVAHVGHEHPDVVAAIANQVRVLNTNSRYPHPERIRYMERLAAQLPEPLNTVFLVNSGSEANDLALRIATTVTGRQHIVVGEHGYHGHTAALIDASHYKHAGPGGGGTPSHVTVLPLPDVLRRPDDNHKATSLALLDGLAPAAGLFEAIPGVAGQVVLPEGYLGAVTEEIRRRGGLIVMDEVQTGLGRIGPSMWAFALEDVTPDIVTLGKPIGNGHPLGAVVTSRRVAEAFANGMEYFNTFGGNPVSCAAGNAVLDVLGNEALPEHARALGAGLIERLRELAGEHAIVGDVRGAGLFLGVELVLDRETLRPAPAQTAYVVERARELGVLLSSDGPHHNVLKIKPPLVLDDRHVDVLVDTLGRILSEDAAQPDDRR